MAASAPPQSTSKKNTAHPKLPRLPKHARIQKRPIVRPPIPSPYANSSKQKVVYISSHTPFIPAVKRVRSLLEESEKRAVGPLNLFQGKGSDRQKLRKLTESIEKGKGKSMEDGGGAGGGEEVVLKATGRAIERVLSFALYFQGQPDCVVRIRTGGVGVVDDIVDVEGDVEDGEGGGAAAEQGEEDEEEAAAALPETRVRKTSVVEVAVTLK